MKNFVVGLGVISSLWILLWLVGTGRNGWLDGREHDIKKDQNFLLIRLDGFKVPAHVFSRWLKLQE